MKLQLNSLAALERLIGGDTDVEVEIRNNVIQAFANKYLKIGVEDMVRKELSAIRCEVDSCVSRVVREANLGMFDTSLSCRTALTNSAKKAVRDYAGEVMATAVTAGVDAAVAACPIADIKRLIDNRVESLTKAEVDKRVAARLAAIKEGL